MPVKIAKSRIKDFQPAGNKAILMLANGKQKAYLKFQEKIITLKHKCYNYEK